VAFAAAGVLSLAVYAAFSVLVLQTWSGNRIGLEAAKASWGRATVRVETTETASNADDTTHADAGNNNSLSEITTTTTTNSRSASSECYRRCANYDNLIVYGAFATLQQSGLNDRMSHMRNMAHVATFLCARLIVPTPGEWLNHERHNDGYPATSLSNLTWRDDFVDYPILQQDGNNKSLSAIFGEGINSTVAQLNTSRYKQYRSTTVTELLRDYVAVHRDSFSPSSEKPFLWEITLRMQMKLRDLLARTMEEVAEKNELGTNESTTMLPLKEPHMIRCMHVRQVPSEHVQSIVERILEQLPGKAGCRHFGYLHIRRGDLKNACDTSLPTIKSYLSCTLNYKNTSSVLGSRFPLLIGTDERSQDYLGGLEETVNSFENLRYISLDELVMEELQRQVTLGLLPAHKMNNFLIFWVGKQVMQRAVFQIERTPHFDQCGPCTHLTPLLSKYKSQLC